MTSYQRLVAVRDLLKDKLPSYLGSLPDFSGYAIGEPYRADDCIAGVYTINWTLDAQVEQWGLGLYFQTYSSGDIYAVESAVIPALWNLLVPELVGMVSRDSLESTVFPPRENLSMVLLCAINFRRELDSLDY